MIAKELTFLAHAGAAGIVMGAQVPVILTSRADDDKARLASCAVAVLCAEARAMRLILTLNAGSSSIKVGLYEAGAAGGLGEPRELARGQVEALGAAAVMEIDAGRARARVEIGVADHATALARLIAGLQPLFAGREIAAVGHRIVHGGADIDGPRLLTPELVAELEALTPLAPLAPAP
ncbi:MAG: hypothetical protein ACMUJJ_01120 [Roseicyclus sp.]|uniref:hypothetical protein n=1 Tax=Roseicyclus sp. TaxID=1914329 RepID=UPI003A88F2F4